MAPFGCDSARSRIAKRLGKQRFNRRAEALGHPKSALVVAEFRWRVTGIDGV
jgi:hypothetical protein